jgi:hypothetical protein
VRYSYVEPAPVVAPPPHLGKATVPVLKRAELVGVDHPEVPGDARRMVVAAREARPSWVVKLTHSVTLNAAGNALVHHVFVRVYGADGEPLGYCGWSAGHTVGGHIWREIMDPDVGGTTYRQVGVTEFAAWAQARPYTPPTAQPVTRGTCPACERSEVRAKLNGIPYSHRAPATDLPCAWRIPYRLIGEAT